MNINQLIYISLLLIILSYYCNNNIYEGLNKDTINSCLKRIINNECLDEEKKIEINRECGSYSILLEKAQVNLHCDEKILTNTLLCKKMKLQGACESDYGRKQMRGICYDDHINIKCPFTIDQKNNIIIQKIQDLEKKNIKCEKRIKDKNLEISSNKNENKDCDCSASIILKKYTPLLIMIVFLFLLFKKKRKK